MTDRNTLVLLVRHGETTTTGKVLPGRAKGLHLSERGVEQAENAARRISVLSKVEAVYCSPMERTRETAKPIAEGLGLDRRTSKGLIECDFGEWTGKSLSRLRKRPQWHAVQNSPSAFRFPGGESFVEMQNRIWSQLLELVRDHPGSTIVAISHADPIKAAVAMAAGIPLDLFQRLVISPCSISAVLFTMSGPVILTINSTGDELGSLAPS